MTLFSKHSMHILLAYATHSILMDVQIAFFNGAYSIVHIWKKKKLLVYLTFWGEF
jgi:hypothetical protein